MSDLVLAVLLVTVGALPYWVAGRLVIPSRERLPWTELDWAGHWTTLRRGADVLRPRGPWTGYADQDPR
jgi:hypothetical protein